MHERRTDDRTDTDFSLRNLLSLRAEREQLGLAVVGTDQGLLVAGSRQDRVAQRAAAHASDQLFRGPAAALCSQFVWESPRGARLRGQRFAVDGSAMFLAVLDRSRAGLAGPDRDAKLDEMVARVITILGERRARALC